MALVNGASRFPVLSNLLPARQILSESCEMCGGTGQFVPTNATGWLYCPDCRGVGWKGNFTVPLPLHPLGSQEAPYLPFEEAAETFEEFVRAQTGFNVIVFASRADITLMRRRTYVRLRNREQARAEARREYEQAVRRRLGVGFFAPCSLRDGSVVACVDAPADLEEAVRLMYPDGIRYSVPQTLERGTVVGRGGAMVLRLFRRRDDQ
jgi:hypothetical protein